MNTDRVVRLPTSECRHDRYNKGSRNLPSHVTCIIARAPDAFWPPRPPLAVTGAGAVGLVTTKPSPHCRSHPHSIANTGGPKIPALLQCPGPLVVLRRRQRMITRQERCFDECREVQEEIIHLKDDREGFPAAIFAESNRSHEQTKLILLELL